MECDSGTFWTLEQTPADKTIRVLAWFCPDYVRIFCPVSRERHSETTIMHQTSVDKDNESLESSVSSLSGWTDRQGTAFQNYGQNPDTWQNRDRQNSDRRTPDSIFHKIPDRIRAKTRRGQGRDSAVRRRLSYKHYIIFEFLSWIVPDFLQFIIVTRTQIFQIVWDKPIEVK